jgi:hypothetical protein
VFDVHVFESLEEGADVGSQAILPKAHRKESAKKRAFLRAVSFSLLLLSAERVSDGRLEDRSALGGVADGS